MSTFSPAAIHFFSSGNISTTNVKSPDTANLLSRIPPQNLIKSEAYQEVQSGVGYGKHASFDPYLNLQNDIEPQPPEDEHEVIAGFSIC